MRILFEFDTENYDLTASHMARILLDIQHLAIVCVSLAKESFERDDVVFNEYLRHYKGMVEARIDDLDDSEVSIVRLKMESPLEVEVVLKKLAKAAVKPVADAFRFIINKIFFVDLEREKKSLENALMREEITQRKIKNASQALNLAKKIPNSHLREQFIESLTSSVMPFEVEHPPLKSVKVIEEDN
jgi:hypothetical protein